MESVGSLMETVSIVGADCLESPPLFFENLNILEFFLSNLNFKSQFE